MYPQVFGKYVLERELSRGGMARVVLATLRGAGGFEKKLVVKQIRDELAHDQQFIRRFVEEAKTTVALSHPNIVPVYELGVEQGTYFLAMELVEGLSVTELLRGSSRTLSPEEGAYVGVEVCRALDYAHRRMNVVHRDITPRNVMIDEEGQIKLIDFGIAAPALVAGQEILGSPGHMAPEQVDGGELGPPTDIFAVAVLLMEAWSGAAPFRRSTPEECAAAVRGPHPRPSDFDARLLPLDEAIGRAMSVDARQRQQQASELARALRSFLQGIDVADVARALGDRVREDRDSASVAVASARGLVSARPSTASHAELGTRTFAAREEALRWSSPPAADAGGRAAGADPAMAIPTPLMVNADELDQVRADLATRRAGAGAPTKQVDAPDAEKIETIATRPIETPVRAARRGSEDATEAAVAPKKGRPRGAGVVVGLVLGVTAIAAWRVRAASPGAGPSHGAAEATVVSGPGASSVGASSGAAGTSRAEAPNSPSAGVAGVVAGGTGAGIASAASGASGAGVAAPSGAAAARTASVALLGEPGTRVAIDGVAKGICPIRLQLAEGSHEIRFTFDPTGETRIERITLTSAERVTLRAEFTGATPTVKIQR